MSFKNIKYGKKTERRNYSKMMYDVDLPDLIEIQTQSFEKFIKSDLLELLKELSPIEGNNGDIKLYFESVEVQEPNFTIAESKTRDITYSAQVMADVKLENCIHFPNQFVHLKYCLHSQLPLEYFEFLFLIPFFPYFQIKFLNLTLFY